MSMATVAQIEAARRFAPPLLVTEQVDRRGARLRHVNRRAVEYAQRAGMQLEDVYPGALAIVRAMAPPAGSIEAPTFVRAVGLRFIDVYPPAGAGIVVAGETPSQALRTRWRWVWPAAGLLVGAAVAGPVGLVVGGGFGVLAGGAR